MEITKITKSYRYPFTPGQNLAVSSDGVQLGPILGPCGTDLGGSQLGSPMGGLFSENFTLF